MTARSCPTCHKWAEDWWSYCPWCGRALLTDPARASVSPASASSSPCDDPGPGLTARQRDILVAWAERSSLKEAAAQCGISLNTAKAHVTHAYARLGVASMQEAFRTLGWLVVP